MNIFAIFVGASEVEVTHRRRGVNSISWLRGLLDLHGGGWTVLGFRIDSHGRVLHVVCPRASFP